MADLIDKQSVVDIAMCYCPDDDGSCSKADADIRELLDEIENLQAVNRWIPCSERLPDNGVAVLVYTGENNFKVWLAEYSKYMEVWTLAGNYIPIKKNAVTHWMPLPKPPEGED